MKYIALFLSGGMGSRIGGEVPKQYVTVGDRPLFSYSLDVLISYENIDGVRIVADPEWEGEISSSIRRGKKLPQKFMGFSLPGATRQLSILNGIRDIISDVGEENAPDTCIIIHDAARPILKDELLDRLIEGVAGHDGALPVLPMKDTIYRSAGGKRVSELLNRDELFAGQAPELFDLTKYIKANRALYEKAIDLIRGASEPAVLAGMDIVMIPGDEGNFKVTTDSDLERYLNKAGGESI